MVPDRVLVRRAVAAGPAAQGGQAAAGGDQVPVPAGVVRLGRVGPRVAAVTARVGDRVRAPTGRPEAVARDLADRPGAPIVRATLRAAGQEQLRAAVQGRTGLALIAARLPLSPVHAPAPVTALDGPPPTAAIAARRAATPAQVARVTIRALGLVRATDVRLMAEPLKVGGLLPRAQVPRSQDRLPLQPRRTNGFRTVRFRPIVAEGVPAVSRAAGVRGPRAVRVESRLRLRCRPTA